ncbi:hypothetical protein P3T36_006989 [Kitasatospora sp. MAP12-15]|uniref:DUF2637 domain-containing protein n=2 Tax=Kitasatospora TaxID=2063 RepID=UPI00247F14E2|nr:hypothetical protein [Kitasatospora sp. MAP12-44]
MSHVHIEQTDAEPRNAVSLQGMTGWDRAAVTLLGAAGFAFSYDALRQIAIAIHARESLSYLFPVFIDGFIAYGVRAILLLRHRPFFARLYTWFLFLSATAASLGANALHAITLNRGPQSAQSPLHLTDTVVAVLSMLAPLALAGSVHLYILMARTAELSVPDRTEGGPGLVRQDAPPPASTTTTPESHPAEAASTTETTGVAAPPSPAVSATRTTVDLRKSGSYQHSEPAPDGSGVRPSAAAGPAGEEQDQVDNLATAPADREALPQSAGAAEAPVSEAVRVRTDGEELPVPNGAWAPQDREALPPLAAAEAPAPEAVRTHADDEEPSVPDDVELPQDREADDEWLHDLLPVARAASRQAGRISRDAIQEAVRARLPISNDRLGILLARLKDEEDRRAEAPAGASSTIW